MASKSYLKTKFRYKKLSKRPIKSVATTIARAFSLRAQPVDTASEQDLITALEYLGMTASKIVCIYCGKAAETWDHFHGLVFDKQPKLLPYSIFNYVPSCDKCNESRRSAHWEEWVSSMKEKKKWWGNSSTEAARFKRLRKYYEKSSNVKAIGASPKAS